jgi:hypothetical protein
MRYMEYPHWIVWGEIGVRLMDEIHQILTRMHIQVLSWLVVLTILKNIRKWEGLFHILWTKKFQTTKQII